jgi:hypothetical protein
MNSLQNGRWLGEGDSWSCNRITWRLRAGAPCGLTMNWSHASTTASRHLPVGQHARWLDPASMEEPAFLKICEPIPALARGQHAH